jgi:cytochrome c556
MQTLSQELLETCRQLNGLLKTKDPYHSEIVERMLNKIENEQNKDSDRDLILKALTGVL